MADNNRWKPARWRRWNDSPPTYRLRRGRTDLVAVQQTKDQKWFWHTIEATPLRNTASNPVGTLEEAQRQAKEWVESHGF